MASDIDPLILDRWATLSFKRALGNRKSGGTSWVQPPWVGDHARRLQGYNILTALASNTARHYLQADETKKQQHREYGDAALIVETALAALLGDDQRIVTEGAEDFDPDDDTELDEDGNEVEVDDEILRTRREAEAAAEFQAWAAEWAASEHFGRKNYETEGNAVRLGDGVYALAWSASKGRPRLRIFDPGSYFPVLDDGNEDDFPETVHVAWEIVPENENDPKRRIHRLTWRLVDTGEARSYPWNETTTTLDVLYSDAIWTIDSSGKQTVTDFTDAEAEWQTVEDSDGQLIEARDVPLGLDFIPVVHVPNTPSTLDHFGLSTLATVAQILDDLANADTDLQAASDTTAQPMIGLSNVNLPTDSAGNEVSPEYKAGAIWKLGSDGSASMIDTSAALDALLKYADHLLARLSTNSRLPASVLGRVDPGEITSGVHLLLSFGPMRSMISQMRLVRTEKNPLIFKFAHRVALAGGMVDTPEAWIPTTVEYGRYLPEDTSAVVTQVSSLYAAHLISLETALLMLMEAGVPIEDVAEEARRLRETDYESAEGILSATGDRQAARDFLGLEGAPPAEPRLAAFPTLGAGGPSEEPSPGVNPAAP